MTGLTQAVCATVRQPAPMARQPAPTARNPAPTTQNPAPTARQPAPKVRPQASPGQRPGLRSSHGISPERAAQSVTPFQGSHPGRCSSQGVALGWLVSGSSTRRRLCPVKFRGLRTRRRLRPVEFRGLRPAGELRSAAATRFGMRRRRAAGAAGSTARLPGGRPRRSAPCQSGVGATLCRRTP